MLELKITTVDSLPLPPTAGRTPEIFGRVSRGVSMFFFPLRQCSCKRSGGSGRFLPWFNAPKDAHLFEGVWYVHQEPRQPANAQVLGFQMGISPSIHPHWGHIFLFNVSIFFIMSQACSTFFVLECVQKKRLPKYHGDSGEGFSLFIFVIHGATQVVDFWVIGSFFVYFLCWSAKVKGRPSRNW